MHISDSSAFEVAWGFFSELSVLAAPNVLRVI